MATCAEKSVCAARLSNKLKCKVTHLAAAQKGLHALDRVWSRFAKPHALWVQEVENKLIRSLERLQLHANAAFDPQ